MRVPTYDYENDGPGLTPLIDVVFLLLIFFLVATRFNQEERELDQRFEELRPVILGAILDGVRSALQNHASVCLGSRPRMADLRRPMSLPQRWPVRASLPAVGGLVPAPIVSGSPVPTG